MRELGRGGSLVAATIAALHNRTAAEEKPRGPVRPRVPTVETRNVLTLNEDISEDCLRRASYGSERPLSTASEASERDSASVQSSEEPPPQESGDSDSPDEATVKCTVWSEGAIAGSQPESSESDSSSSSGDDSEARDYEVQGDDADYRTLTPSRRLDNSTRRDDDFKWMPTGNMVDDAVEQMSEAKAESYSAASLDSRRRRPPSDRSERDRKSRSSLNSKPPQHPSSVRASPRPRRTRNEETPPELQRRWNSYEHFRWPEGGWWPPMCWCHGPPMPPPCYMHDRSWPSHPSLPQQPPVRGYKNDAEDRVRRLEADKESLQLQVQVLSEQIAAQSEKMTDLERALLDARQRLDDAEQRLQKEMLQRSSLETQKLELLSKLSEMRLRVAERGLLERSPPPDTASPLPRPAPPRTPPANYGRQIERNTHMYSSLPRSSVVTSEARVAFGNKQNNMVVARGRGHSVPNLAEKEEVSRGSPSPSLREVRARLGSGAGVRLEGDDLPPATRTPSRPPATPAPWESTDVREWDCDTTCAWLEALGLEASAAAARAWLAGAERGALAAAHASTIEKELALKHPMHKKKIVLAITDLLGGHGDPLLSAAGRLDCAWVVRWLEDVGVCGARGAAQDAALDGRALHRLTHHELHVHLRVTHALHALAVKRGIQVLRDNGFDADTMLRRGVQGEGGERAPAVPAPQLARWSSHRVMQWLKEIDLAEYAPNLRGAGVHGGLMLLEPRFTAELLAALLNIPANKTLLRRHLTQRFNELLGREVIQQKRNAEQTLGYQPLTATTKYKVPKKSQFSLKRKKSKDELDLSDLVCPLHDDCSGDITTSPTMKVKSVAAAGVASGVCPPRDDARAH